MGKNKGKRVKKGKKAQQSNATPSAVDAEVLQSGIEGVPPHDPEVDKPLKKGKKKVAKEKPPGEVVIPPIGASTKTKIDTKEFEQLRCACCSKPLWAKDQLSGALIPGCSCGLYQPGHAKCSKCSLHCTCEGRVHG